METGMIVLAAAQEKSGLPCRHSSRMQRRIARCTLLLLWGALPLAAVGESHYVLDPAQSSVRFALTGPHEVDGTFHIDSGDVSFDRATGKMSGKIVVASTSGDSGNDSRDKKMKKDQLKVSEFPDVTFAPSSFTGQLGESGSSQIQVQGTFTLLGQPHEITVPMTVQINGTHCTAVGTFNVPYVQWGVRDPSIFMLKVGKDVRIDLSLTGQIAPAS
jgi:polyisoprenoid-binding protein YceI